MGTRPGQTRARLRYAANENPPRPVSLIIGVQVALLVCIPVVIVTTILARVADQSDAYLSWAIFASMVIGGAVTVIQAKRPGAVGAGNLIVMGTAGVSIGVAAIALTMGGPPLLATLVVASALCQFVLGARLALLRRIITPLVSGTLLALVSVTVMPLGFAMLTRVAEGAPATAAPVIATVTIITVVALMLRAPRKLRAWTPVIGIAAGCATAAVFGVLDLAPVAAARWFGLPAMPPPGLDLAFDSRFWILLPGFLFVTFVITVRQVGDAVRIQRLSRREPKAIDFRRVEGAVTACGVGTLLSGLAGVLPPWSYAAGNTLARGPGVASRQVGVYIGACLIALAFVPKIHALLVSIPAPVLGAYVIVIFGMTLTQGMRVVLQEGAGQRNLLIAGLSFWIGAGIQFRLLFPDLLGTPTGSLVANGLTAGGLSVILLSLFVEFTGPRRRRIDVPLSQESLPELDRFLVDFASRYGWSGSAAERLRAASEEALLSLLRGQDEAHAQDSDERRLRVVARNTRDRAVLEFTAATRSGNLENRMMLLGDRPDPTSERDLSLALLRHHAASVKHQEYHNVDVLAVRVDR